jgi:hypothetical protein
MKDHVRRTTKELGDEAICSRLGVTSHAVRSARFKGAFPAAWFVALKEMCDEKGIDCPEAMFNFKSPSSASLSEAS